MSGPITRQYGVPNWDDIFGKKDEQPANSKESKEPVDRDESGDSNSSADRSKESRDKP
jgi:hypothetical protein